jgi:hypothetical protein
MGQHDHHGLQSTATTTIELEYEKLAKYLLFDLENSCYRHISMHKKYNNNNKYINNDRIMMRILIIMMITMIIRTIIRIMMMDI